MSAQALPDCHSVCHSCAAAETQGVPDSDGDTGVGLQQDGGGVRASRRVGELVSERAGG